MLFAPKTKAFFFEQTEHGCFLARASVGGSPLVVEELREIPAAELATLPGIARELSGRKNAGGYLHAVCGVYPSSRVIRRAAIEPKRAREGAYLNETVTTQFRLEAEQHTLCVLQSADGCEFDGSRPAVREALFCGARTEELESVQDALLERGIYPERLELGTISTLGALVDYLGFRGHKTPILVLELGQELTQSFIVHAGGIEIARPIPFGLGAMLPVVQKELGLKDEESARKLFFSNTFDFTGLGPQLTRRLMKELQSSIGFYEVQTGQSIGHLLCTQLPPKLGWLQGAFAQALGVPPLPLEFGDWLQARHVALAPSTAVEALDQRWLGLFSLILSYDAVPAEEKK